MLDKRENVEELLGIDDLSNEKLELELAMIHSEIFHSAFYRLTALVMFIILLGLLGSSVMKQELLSMLG